MAKLVCRVAIPEALERAFPLIDALLKTLGFSLTNPDTAKVTTWTDDGDQNEIPATNVVGDVVLGALQNVQFWRAASEDIFLAWEEDTDKCTFAIYLDGLDSVSAIRVIAEFVELVLTKLRTRYGEGVALTVEFE